MEEEKSEMKAEREEKIGKMKGWRKDKEKKVK